MQIIHRQLQHVLRRVEQSDAAVGKVPHHLRLEDHVEAVDRRVGHSRLDHVDVVGKAVDGMQIGHGVHVAGIGRRLDREHVRIEIAPVRQLAAVERRVDAGFYLAAEVAGGGADHVVAGVAGHHLGLECLIGIVGVVYHLDARAALEFGDGVLADVIRPVVDVQDPVVTAARGFAGTEQQRQ
jgi:hypothetical protein